MINNFKFKYFIYKTISKFNFNSVRDINGLRILMYHSIGDKVDDDAYNIYNMSQKLFLEHVEIFKKFNLISLKPNIINHMPSGIAITFDDGFSNNLHIANKILAPLEIPFTVFVTANNVKEDKHGFLSQKELLELSRNKNVVIGSHSMNHIHLAKYDKSRIMSELYESKVYLEDIIGQEVYSLSYPNGSVNKLVRDCAANVGYKLGLTSRSCINNPTRDKLLLHRTPIWSEDHHLTLEDKIHGKWDWLRYRHRDPAIDLL